MKKIIFLFFLFIATNAFSQISPDLAIVKYKNGIYYVGEKIEEENDFVSLKLNTADTIQIDKNQLAKYYDSNNAIIFPNGKYFDTSRKFWSFSFGFNALGVLDSVDQRVSTHLEIMYANRLTKNLNIGFGAGFEFNEARVSGFQFDTQFTSLFVYGRYYITNKPKRIFLFSRLGFGFSSEDNVEGVSSEHSGGFNSLTGLGIHFASRKKSRFQLMIGFYTQKTNGREFFLDNIGNEVQTNYDILIKRLMFKFGWEFG
jgi:hypothetical protein